MPPDPLIIASRDGAPNHPPPVDLGARLRELRTERGWSLDEASGRTGLSRSSLYKVEKGKMSPTFDALKKLSEGFDLDIARLLVTHSDTRAASRRCITRHGDGTAYTTENYTYVPLAEDLAHKAMLPFRLTIKARALDDFDDWDRHDTEDFVHVLTGTMVDPVWLNPESAQAAVEIERLGRATARFA